jgi:RNA polymerase sigma factor (sigma-70 family)
MIQKPLRKLVEHLRQTAATDEGDLTDGLLLTRFLTRRDEAAFGTLLRRHGPMVLGVCRRVLCDAHDAEDAFQATFLVLVRKAPAIRQRGLLGNWLYGVAYRTALEAKAAAARRRAKERAAARPEAVEGQPPAERCHLLDQELNGLPERYRLPLLLCDLEGKTRREAARLLGCPEGTVSGRLARARALLARRLSRRGTALAGGTIAVELAQEGALASMPAGLAGTTVRAAARAATGQNLLGSEISANVTLLTQGVLRAMWLTKMKIAMTILLAVTAIGVGAGSLYFPAAAGRATGSADAKPGQPTKAGAGKPAALDRKAAAEGKLGGTVSVNFQQHSVRDALEFLRDKSGLNLVVDRSALQQEGQLEQPVTLRLEGVTLKTVLRYLMRDTGLTYTIEDGILVVSATPDSRNNLERRVYLVADLVSAGEKADNLIEVITKTVEPLTWGGAKDEAGQGSGSIAYFVEGQSLVVNQSPAVQGQVEKLLTDLRAARKAIPQRAEPSA